MCVTGHLLLWAKLSCTSASQHVLSQLLSWTDLEPATWPLPTEACPALLQVYSLTWLASSLPQWQPATSIAPKPSGHPRAPSYASCAAFSHCSAQSLLGRLPGYPVMLWLEQASPAVLIAIHHCPIMQHKGLPHCLLAVAAFVCALHFACPSFAEGAPD